MNRWEVRVDGDGKIDTQHLQGQLEKKALHEVDTMVSGWIWGLIIGGIILLAFVGVGVYLFWTVRSAVVATSAPSTAGLRVATWDGKSPFACAGNDHVVLQAITANLTTGSALSASGNCELTLKNVNVSAPVALEAAGNARVTLEGGSLKGTDKAIDASGNAQVTLKGATVTGKLSKTGLARIEGAK